MADTPTSAPAVHAAVLAALRAAPGTVTVYDGAVTDPPKDARGRVYGYLVLWAGFGARPTAAQSLCGWDGSEADHPFQVTAAAGTASWCLQTAALADAALLDVDLPGNGSITRTTDTGPVRYDEDVTPARYFLPLLYRARTG